MKFLRGIAVSGNIVEEVIATIKQQGLHRDCGKVFLWSPPHDAEALFSKSDLSEEDTRCLQIEGSVGHCFTGDEATAAFYAREHNRSRENSIPVMIQIQAKLETVRVDGNDFLYHSFQFGPPEKFRSALVSLFGQRILRYAERAWISEDQSKRRALCDLAVYDEEVVKAHYRNKLVMGGRCHTRFRSSFTIRAPTEAAAIDRVWIPTEPLQLPQPSFDIYALLQQGRH